MRIGFGAPVSGAWATPTNVASFTAQAEAAGYASVWTFQRLIVPVEMLSGIWNVCQLVPPPKSILVWFVWSVVEKSWVL